MTKEQLAELAAGPPTPMGLERLLEERKRLLEALRELASSPRLDADEEDYTDHKRAVEALDFADEEAP